MPIGIVTDEEFLAELAALTPPTPATQSHVVESAVVIDKPTRGRTDGDVNVPDSLRQIIGETAVIEGRQAALNIANQFGISASSVSAYAKGATSTTTYNEPKSSILSHINKSRRRAITRAGKTLNHALESITQEKLDYADVKDLAGIAKDMSVIIKNLEPKDVVPSDESKAPQFVIFAPTFRDERSFGEVIQVNE